MAIDKLLPRYLNKDDDERLIKSVEMSDAQNIRISSDDTGNSLIVKNAFGNAVVQLATSLPSGTNEVIGFVADDQAGEIYYFVWNSNSSHSIYRYTSSTNQSSLVCRDSVLEFSRDKNVQADVVKNKTGDTLLYFNDGASAPKKINASKALRGQYPALFTSGTTEQRLLFYTTAKQPPLAPPVLQYRNQSNIDNEIRNDHFQFTYQYVYDDGEHSALAPYSELSVNPGQLKDGFITDAKRRFLNVIRVFVTPSVADVKEIRVFARRGDQGTFYEVDKINNSPSATSQYVDFRGLAGLTPLGTLTQDKLYDNVPQIADSQAIAGGRLFYGGHTEGYDSIPTSVTTFQNLQEIPIQYNIGIEVPSPYEKEFVIDYSQLPASFATDSTVLMNFFVDTGKIKIATKNAATVSQSYTAAALTYLVPGVGLIYSAVTAINNFSRNEYPHYDAQFVDVATAAASLLQNRYPRPRIVFQDNNNENDKKTKNKEVNAIKDGIRVLSSGIQVRVAIEIPKNSTRAQAITIIENQVLKSYPTIVSPQFGDAGVSGLDVAGWTPFTSEQLSLQGKGTMRISKVGLYAADKFKYNILLDNIELEAAEFFNGNGNKVDVLRTENKIKVREGIITQQIVYVKDFNVMNAGCFSSISIDGSRGFKSGANHQLGIVYFDDRGRSSTVHKLPPLKVSHLNDRSGANILKGNATAVLRIAHQPPAYAKRWAPVYVGQGSVINKIQYSTSDAFVSKNRETTEGNASSNKSIYVSFRGLEGKKNSYKETYNPLIDYNFSEGDKLRICYSDYTGTFKDYVFNVKGYTYFDSDLRTNPILNPQNKGTTFNTTGKFLVLEDNSGAAGFSYADIAKGNHYWSANTVVEIFRDNDYANADIYYEVGKSYEINPSAANKHGGDRVAADTSNISAALAFTYTSFGQVMTIGANKRMYPGDYVKDSNNLNRVARVIHSYYEDNPNGLVWRHICVLYGGTWSSGSGYTLEVDNDNEAVCEVTQGDSYFRLRLLLGTTSGFSDATEDDAILSAAANNGNGIVKFVEDQSVSDFYKSDYSSKGRPHVYLPDAARVKRTASVTYSDPYSGVGKILSLSSFNLGLSNYYDFNNEHGSIKYLYGKDDVMYVMQERRIGQAAIGKNVIQFTDGGGGVTASRDVLAPISYYQGSYGVNGNPESVAIHNGSIYFSDVKSGKVMRVSRDGLTAISEQGLDSYFSDNFRSIVNAGSNQFVIGGVDVENDEFIVSSKDIYTSGVSVTSGGTTYTYQAETDASNTKVIAPYVLDNTPIFKFNTEEREWQEICDLWEQSIDSMVFLDKLIDGDPVYISVSLGAGGVPVGNRYGIATNSTYDFFSAITYDMVDGSFVFNNDFCAEDSNGTIGESTKVFDAFTIAYDMEKRVWNTRYSFIPERIASMHNILYTFKDGRIYKHSDAVPRNTFYGAGSPSESIVEVVFNENPSKVKSYNSFSIEGSHPWDVTLSNTDQSTTISKTSVTAGGVTYPHGDYEKLERGFFAEVPRDSSANSLSGGAITNATGTSELFAMGVVSAVSSSNITFSTPINDIPFPIGGSLWKVSSGTLVSVSLTVSSVGGENTITANATASTVSVGDELIVIASGAVEGDVIRDYWAKAKLTLSSSNDVELYAINAVYSDSSLHNELGQ
jgi:hypothetical protein